jgi:ribonucleotide monophosphatase NagD (HAD superfamily)
LLQNGKLKVIFIGEAGFKYELQKMGIECVEIEGDTMSDDQLVEYTTDPSVKAVVVGIDFSFNYRKLAVASLYI